MLETRKQYYFISLYTALTFSSLLGGCISAAARVGYGIPVSDAAKSRDSGVPDGVYGGPAFDVGFYHGDNPGPEKERTVYVGIEWSMLMAAEPGERTMTVLPLVGLFNNPDMISPRRVASPLTSLGGYLGAGLEIQRRHLGIHSALCGGYFTYVQGYACARGGSRGWIGFDLNGAVAAPSNIYEIFSTVGDFFDGGWYYMG